MKKTLLLGLIVCILSLTNSWSQISFCPGNTGEAIFEENFGQGTTNGPPLGPEITSYTYVSQAPEDGQYTISSNLMQLDSFHNTQDHTNDVNGKALIVNASFDSGLFYQIPIDGLCENNPYEFSAYLINLYNTSTGVCPNDIPVNVRFQIWDETDTNILAEGSTGAINGTNTPQWEQYGVFFETLPGQTSVILKMLNNGGGGCGNDLAIDDIVFRSCGDLTEIFDQNDETSFSICENENVENLSLSAEPDFSVYETHFYQWQQSSDNFNWDNIEGETNATFEVNEINGSQYYRVLVAEDLINVNNTLCNSISNTFEVIEQELIPAESLGDVAVCEGEEALLEVENDPEITVDWYDAPTDGNLLLADSFSFITETSGTYYAQSTTVNGNCVNENRTPISLEISPSPEDTPEIFSICPGDSIVLDATLPDITYLWSTDETTPQITVSESGTYSVERTINDGCSSIKEFEVIVNEAAVIQNIRSDGNNIIIDLENEGDFLFAIDDEDFQSSPIFENVPGGRYNISIQNNDCGTENREFIHLVIPQYFTPNNDGFNDFFRIPADRFFDTFSIYIFDRFGKLIVAGEQAPFEWDGTYQGKPLPSQDFWYKIVIDGITYTGHVTLIR